ncbi:MAG: PorP/SprF family type IX secretion system membrane protein [Brumimicrobium sp.]|nr:PorP/SprF family type IX secretion system membrane protein [Brumimicrobium sp.]
MKKLGHIFVWLLVCSATYAQDIHWSQFDYNPVFQNPANVGRFNGDYRFFANYRDQWRSVTKAFSTISVSVEAKNLYKGISVGAFFFHDVEGDGKMRTIEFQPSVSYTLKLSADSTHLFRPGLQLGINNRSLDPTKFYYDNQWDGTKFDQNLPNNEVYQTRKRTNFTIGIGAAYEFQKSKRERINVGIGVFNLNRPNQGFFGQKMNREIRLNVFAQAEYKIGYDWDILPSLQMNFQGKYREFILGSQVRYILKDRLGEYMTVMGGLYYRAQDALYLLVGMEYQSWWAGVSYDINASSLVPASTARGGIELSVRYIFFNFKPKKIFHRACPDYI